MSLPSPPYLEAEETCIICDARRSRRKRRGGSRDMLDQLVCSRPKCAQLKYLLQPTQNQTIVHHIYYVSTQQTSNPRDTADTVIINPEAELPGNAPC